MKHAESRPIFNRSQKLPTSLELAAAPPGYVLASGLSVDPDAQVLVLEAAHSMVAMVVNTPIPCALLCLRNRVRWWAVTAGGTTW